MKIHKLPEIDQISKEYSIVFVRDKDHTLCLSLIMLRLVLSPIHILNSLIVPALTISLALSLRPTSSSQSPSLCLSPWKKCVAQVSASPSWPQMDSWLHSCLAEMSLMCFLWDLWIGCCMYTILVCTLVGCVCVGGWSGQCAALSDERALAGKRMETSCNLLNNHIGTKPVLPGSSFFREPPVWF
jgi:hypothetical protein